MQSSMSADNFLCTVLVNVAMQLFSLLLLRLLSAFLSAQAHPKSTFYTHTLQRNVQEHFYLYHRAYRKAPAAVQDILRHSAVSSPSENSCPFTSIVLFPMQKEIPQNTRKHLADNLSDRKNNLLSTIITLPENFA